MTRTCKFNYISDNGKTSERVLFGDMIDRVGRYIMKDPEKAFAQLLDNTMLQKLKVEGGKDALSTHAMGITLSIVQETTYQSFQRALESSHSLCTGPDGFSGRSWPTTL